MTDRTPEPEPLPVHLPLDLIAERPFPTPPDPVQPSPNPDTPILFKTPNLVPRLIHESTHTEYPISYDLRIGQDEGTDITLTGNDVANHHAIIKRENEQFVLVINGRHHHPTSLNDAPVSHRITLKNGDLIQIGQHRLRFLL